MVQKSINLDLIPKCAMENNVNGSTSKFGPVTKKLITTSSKDKVNANNHP